MALLLSLVCSSRFQSFTERDSCVSPHYLVCVNGILAVDAVQSRWRSDCDCRSERNSACIAMYRLDSC